MSGRNLVASGTPWESIVGYSRAVRVGPLVEVSGTTSTGSDGQFLDGDVYEQTRRVLANVQTALAHAGASLGDVVRTRIYVTDITQWEDIGRAHAEAFAEIRPATCMVQVAALIDSRMLVEIEATAYVAGGAP